MQCLSRMSRHVRRFIEAWLQLIFEDRAKHNVNIDISFLGMSKCARQSADNLETELLPKTDRGYVGRNDKIKLHCAKAKVPRSRDMFGSNVYVSAVATISRKIFQIASRSPCVAARITSIRPQLTSSGLKSDRNCRNPFPTGSTFPLAESTDCSLIQARVTG